jgi:DNA-binding MarR family transcriptional regulator
MLAVLAARTALVGHQHRKSHASVPHFVPRGDKEDQLFESLNELPPPHHSTHRPRSLGDLCIRRWQSLMRFRRHMDQVLMSLDLNFTRWVGLEATQRLTAATRDAVNQKQVAQCLDMDAMTMSYVMRRLEQDGFVDRGPDASGPAYRIIVTEIGERVAKEGRARLEQNAGSLDDV